MQTNYIISINPWIYAKKVDPVQTNKFYPVGTEWEEKELENRETSNKRVIL